MKTMKESYIMGNSKTISNVSNVDHPDAKMHQQISFIKSAFRIAGYTLLPFSIVWATLVLVFSELLGIVEEMV